MKLSHSGVVPLQLLCPSGRIEHLVRDRAVYPRTDRGSIRSSFRPVSPLPRPRATKLSLDRRVARRVRGRRRGYVIDTSGLVALTAQLCDRERSCSRVHRHFRPLVIVESARAPSPLLLSPTAT